MSNLEFSLCGLFKITSSGHCLHVNHIRLWESSSECVPWNHLVWDSDLGSATSNLHEFDQVVSALCIYFLICNNADITYLLERSVMSLKSLQYGLWHISSWRKHHRCLCFCNYCSWIGEANLTPCFRGRKKCFLDEGWSQFQDRPCVKPRGPQFLYLCIWGSLNEIISKVGYSIPRTSNTWHLCLRSSCWRTQGHEWGYQPEGTTPLSPTAQRSSSPAHNS